MKVLLLMVAIFETLATTVLGEYDTTTNKINCDEPFKFCSNKRPSNAPGSCERNGGYSDDLDFDTSSSADYSQYRGAKALKPCFNKEMEDLGFEGDEEFRTIDIFTTNNFRARPGEENRKRNGISEGYGRYKRQNFERNNLNNLNAISIVFEEPGSRMELINYLNDPNIPERSCFNDSSYIDGKELYKRLCLPKPIKNYGAPLSSDEKTFDQCTRDADRSNKVQKRQIRDAFYPNQKSYSRSREPKKIENRLSSGPTNPIEKILDTLFYKRKNSPKKVRPTYTYTYSNTHESEKEEPAYAVSSEYSGISSAYIIPKPPKQRYGVRIRQRQDFPCDDPALPRYMQLCKNLKRDGKIVECGDKRFSKCDSVWDDCIEEDEKYLREETDYYKDSFGDTCPAYSPNSQDDPYPGQPFVEKREKPQQQYGYDQYNKYQYAINQHANRVKRQSPQGEVGIKVSDGPICRVYRNTKGERARCDDGMEQRDVPHVTATQSEIAPLDICKLGTDTSGMCDFEDE